MKLVRCADPGFLRQANRQLESARFEAERLALAMMEQQNIARVLDAGATEAARFV